MSDSMFLRLSAVLVAVLIVVITTAALIGFNSQTRHNERERELICTVGVENNRILRHIAIRIDVPVPPEVPANCPEEP